MPVTTTTTTSSVIISRYPSGTINIGDSVTFTIISNINIDCNYTSIEWYSDDTLIGVGNPLTLTFNTPTTQKIHAIVNYYTKPSWLGGHFYGGEFKGNFSGGTFHYGNLNDCYYISDTSKPKKFTINI